VFCHSFAYVAHFWAMFGFEPRELPRSKQVRYQLGHPSPSIVDIRRQLDSHYRSISLIFLMLKRKSQNFMHFSHIPVIVADQVLFFYSGIRDEHPGSYVRDRRYQY
jgi:hypothetical protein